MIYECVVSFKLLNRLLLLHQENENEKMSSGKEKKKIKTGNVDPKVVTKNRSTLWSLFARYFINNAGGHFPKFNCTFFFLVLRWLCQWQTANTTTKYHFVCTKRAAKIIKLIDSFLSPSFFVCFAWPSICPSETWLEAAADICLPQYMHSFRQLFVFYLAWSITAHSAFMLKGSKKESNLVIVFSVNQNLLYWRRQSRLLY